MTFKIYKGESVIVEGESPLTITGVAPNTNVAVGEYQVARVDGDKESNRVDIPAFKTLPIAVTGITLTPENMTAISGAASNRQLAATIAPTNATNKAVTYSVSPTTPGLAVNASGVLSWSDAVPTGTYTVTATTADGNKKDTSTLVLSEPDIAVVGIAIAPKAVTLEVGETQQLTPTITPANATNKVVIYSSKAQGIASVDEDGLVTAVTGGSAEITATSYADGSKIDICTVTVVEPVVDVTGVTLSPKTSTGESGTAGTTQLTAAVAPTGATNKAVTYAITPVTTGLTVSNAGLISWTADVAAGTYTTTVTTTDGAKTDTHVLTLTDPEPDPNPEEGE